MGNRISKTEILRNKIRNHLNSLNYDLLSKVLINDFETISVIIPNFCFKGGFSSLKLLYNKETNTFDYKYCTSYNEWITGIDNLQYNQLYKLDSLIRYDMNECYLFISNYNAIIEEINELISLGYFYPLKMLREWNAFYRDDTKHIFKITSIYFSGCDRFRLNITQYLFSDKLSYYYDRYRDSIIFGITDISDFIKKIKDCINNEEYFTLDEIKKVNIKLFAKEKKLYVKNFLDMSDSLFNND